MKRCLIVLDGPEKNDVLRREIDPSDLVVTVDGGLAVCFALNRPPQVAFLDPRTAPEKAADWAAFVGVEREEYSRTGSQDGLDLALEWAFTGPGIDAIDIVNALGASSAIDHARLATLARVRDGGRPAQILTASHRYAILQASLTINGRPGVDFSLIPLDPGGSTVRIVNGRETRHANLSSGTTVLMHQKLKDKIANLEVTAGYFLLVAPR